MEKNTIFLCRKRHFFTKKKISPQKMVSRHKKIIKTVFVNDVGRLTTVVHWLQSSFWSSMAIGDRTDGPRDSGWNTGAVRDPHRTWLSRLEKWEWSLVTTARMTKRIDISEPSVVTWLGGGLREDLPTRQRDRDSKTKPGPKSVRGG
jgi:hypothetical protein